MAKVNREKGRTLSEKYYINRLMIDFINWADGMRRESLQMTMVPFTEVRPYN